MIRGDHHQGICEYLQRCVCGATQTWNAAQLGRTLSKTEIARQDMRLLRTVIARVQNEERSA